jgi:hypothetical protein
MRPLIPRAFSSIPLCSVDMQGHTVSQFYEHYVRLVRENNILTNQVRLIHSEKEALA